MWINKHAQTRLYTGKKEYHITYAGLTLNFVPGKEDNIMISICLSGLKFKTQTRRDMVMTIYVQTNMVRQSKQQGIVIHFVKKKERNRLVVHTNMKRIIFWLMRQHIKDGAMYKLSCCCIKTDTFININEVKVYELISMYLYTYMVIS